MVGMRLGSLVGFKEGLVASIESEGAYNGQAAYLLIQSS